MMQWEKLLSTLRPGLEKPEDFNRDKSRNSYERDYDRVTFSYDFRRMQEKTQVLPFAESDFIHDRLTHSLETSSIGRSLGKLVGNTLIDRKILSLEKINGNDIATIVSTACLAHDIGNPPFGHKGEQAIRSFFRFQPNRIYFTRKNEIGVEVNVLTDSQIKDLKCFDGNPQGLRILADNKRGLALTYATIGAYIKYPWESLKVNGVDKFGFFQSEKDTYSHIANSLELIKLSDSPLEYCRHPLNYLVEAADDIAYRIIDLEDTIVLNYVYFHERIVDIIGKNKIDQLYEQRKIFRPEVFLSCTVRDLLVKIAGNTFSLERFNKTKEIKNKYAYLRALSIGNLINQVNNEFFKYYDQIMSGQHKDPLLKTIELNDEMVIIKEIAIRREYSNEAARQIELSGHEVLGKLLKILLDANIFYDEDDSYKNIIKNMFKMSETDRYLMIMEIIDFVSGMTDTYALSLFQKTHGIRLPQVY